MHPCTHTYLHRVRRTGRRQTDRRADRQTDRQTHRRTDRQKYEHTYSKTPIMIYQHRLYIHLSLYIYIFIYYLFSYMVIRDSAYTKHLPCLHTYIRTYVHAYSYKPTKGMNATAYCRIQAQTFAQVVQNGSEVKLDASWLCRLQAL